MTITSEVSQRHVLATAAAEEAAAQAVLTEPAFAFVNGAAGDGSTKRANEAAWERVTVMPHLPMDVSHRSTESVVFGELASAPIAVAPIGAPAEVGPDADLELARACAEVNIPLVIPTMGSAPLEKVADVEGLNCAFQLYWLRDVGKRWELIRRAEQAGCSALIITVDTPYRLGSDRERSLEFRMRPGVEAANLDGIEDQSIDPNLTWTQIEEVAASTPLPVYVKGVLHPQVAEQAERSGMDGVIVSNHSGRQLSCATPTAAALPHVVNAITRPEVMVDSGIRTGADVLRALALGASGVLVGRQVMYGLAAAGRRGVVDVLTRLRDELDDALACSGCRVVAEARSLTTVIQ